MCVLVFVCVCVCTSDEELAAELTRRWLASDEYSDGSRRLTCDGACVCATPPAALSDVPIHLDSDRHDGECRPPTTASTATAPLTCSPLSSPSSDSARDDPVNTRRGRSSDSQHTDSEADPGQSRGGVCSDLCGAPPSAPCSGCRERVGSTGSSTGSSVTASDSESSRHDRSSSSCSESDDGDVLATTQQRAWAASGCAVDAAVDAQTWQSSPAMARRV